MKTFKIVSVVLFLLTLIIPVYSQENSVVPKRTPEQEASKQTDKLQQELNLSQPQASQIYEINLRYARERQISNKRSEALERMRSKNAEIKQVLNPEQNERLQSKRYERTYLETSVLNRKQTSTSGSKSSANYQANQTVHPPVSSDINTRSTYRPVNPNFKPRGMSDQSTKRSTITITQSPRIQNNPSSSRSSSAAPYNNLNRTERMMQRTSPRTQTMPASIPKKAETPASPSRK
jgi:Na+-transporting methylmalonyl-CoA/oxaloacetate decarboxylase gamma subunit